MGNPKGRFSSTAARRRGQEHVHSTPPHTLEASDRGQRRRRGCVVFDRVAVCEYVGSRRWSATALGRPGGVARGESALVPQKQRRNVSALDNTCTLSGLTGPRPIDAQPRAPRALSGHKARSTPSRITTLSALDHRSHLSLSRPPAARASRGGEPQYRCGQPRAARTAPPPTPSPHATQLRPRAAAAATENSSRIIRATRQHGATGRARAFMAPPSGSRVPGSRAPTAATTRDAAACGAGRGRGLSKPLWWKPAWRARREGGGGQGARSWRRADGSRQQKSAAGGHLQCLRTASVDA